jgi:hypothetical protein
MSNISKNSKTSFGDIIKAARSQGTAEQVEQTKQEEKAAITEVTQNTTSVITRGPGRPKVGKSSNPDYSQYSALLPKELYNEVEIALLRKGRRNQFSSLVEELLSEWLSRTQNIKNT